MKKFVSLVPIAENVHLYKEIGMIPYYMSKEFKCQSFIACYSERSELGYLNDLDHISHLKVNKFFKSELLNCLAFVFKYRKNIDVLMVIHISMHKVYLMIFLKIITCFRAKVYVKMDANPGFVDLGFQNKDIFSRLRIYLYNKFDLISVETKDLYKFFNEKTGLKVEYIPNGFTDEFLDVLPKKENIILTVARLDDPIKNINLLIRAFIRADMKNWKLILVGPYNKDSNIYDKDLQNQIELASNKIEFIGPIYNKQKLNEYYSKAKIFTLTSKSESFGLVYLEAISNGCFIISSDLPSARDITNNGEFGELFPIGDEGSLVDVFRKIDNELQIFPDPLDIRKFACYNFYWGLIVRQLERLLRK